MQGLARSSRCHASACAHPCAASKIPRTVPIVSASAAVLSSLYLYTRAKRRAMPPGYCGLSWTSLKATSTTSSGRT
jgi:hypothetical protein